MSDLIHLIDGGELDFVRMVTYDQTPIEAAEYKCASCGAILEIANDFDYIGSRNDYELLDRHGWKSEYGKPSKFLKDLLKGNHDTL